MKKLFILSVVCSVIFLSGCVPGSESSDSRPSVNSDTDQTDTTQKSGTTTKTGKISKAGSKYFLTVSGQQPQEIDSYGVDLSAFVGKSATVTGQFSGETLFVGQIE